MELVVHDQDRIYAEEEMGRKIKMVYVEEMPYSDEASRLLEQFIADGAKMVIANSEYADFVSKVSDRHPEIMFMECNGAAIFTTSVDTYRLS